MVETVKVNGLMAVDCLMLLFEQQPLVNKDDDLDSLVSWIINVDLSGQQN
ncbi:hypothetical protein [Idiomarina sp.]|nr:hypothetical protein [Idiomarina sp.]